MEEGFFFRDTGTYKKIWRFICPQVESFVGIKTFYIIDPGIREDPFFPLIRPMLFTFKKIRGTIAALNAKKPKPSKNYLHSEKDQYTMEFMRHPPSNKGVKLVVALIVLLPCVWLFNYIIQLFAKSCNIVTTTGLSTILLTFAYDRLRKKLFAIIPFYKLNPYFGNKVEEIINAFKKS